MSELLRSTPIMSVAEFRKVTGTATAHMSDSEIEKHIGELDLVAQLFVVKMKKKIMPMKQNS